MELLQGSDGNRNAALAVDDHCIRSDCRANLARQAKPFWMKNSNYRSKENGGKSLFQNSIFVRAALAFRRAWSLLRSARAKTRNPSSSRANKQGNRALQCPFDSSGLPLSGGAARLESPAPNSS